MTNGLFTCTLTNTLGFEVSVTNYGGAITSLKTPDRYGNFGEIVLGFAHARQINGRRHITVDGAFSMNRLEISGIGGRTIV